MPRTSEGSCAPAWAGEGTKQESRLPGGSRVTAVPSSSPARGGCAGLLEAAVPKPCGLRGLWWASRPAACCQASSYKGLLGLRAGTSWGAAWGGRPWLGRDERGTPGAQVREQDQQASRSPEQPQKVSRGRREEGAGPRRCPGEGAAVPWGTGEGLSEERG